MVSDSVLQCIVGEHAGGTFPVMMRHKTKGSAVSTAVFEYPLTIQNIHPSQGNQECARTYKYFLFFNKHLSDLEENYVLQTLLKCVVPIIH